MGNFTSCYNVELKYAKIVDIYGNQRHIKVPITAAEIMLEEPGHFISPVVDDLRSTFRLSALPADQELSSGRLYMLIPAGRLNSFTTKSELETLRSSACKSKSKSKSNQRRSSKVLPETESESSVDSLGHKDTGFSGYRVGSSPQWKPVLEPIHE